MKILVAEDDPISRHMLEKTLKYWGYETICVQDGAMAMMFLYTKDHPDLALIDWEMPRLSGIKVCEKVRNDPDLKGLYIIMLTARSTKDDMMEGYGSGADDYLTKPVDSGALKESLDRAKMVEGKDLTVDQRMTIRRENVKAFLERIGKKSS